MKDYSRKIQDKNQSPLPQGEDQGEGGLRITNPLIHLARQLRKNSTDAERLLWFHLRARRMNSLKFRRQQPIGPYIVDFICFEKKLIIEVDGGQHNENKNKDMTRTQWLNNQGYQVIRFWNHEVLQNSIDVLEEIWRHCG